MTEEAPQVFPDLRYESRERECRLTHAAAFPLLLDAKSPIRPDQSHLKSLQPKAATLNRIAEYEWLRDARSRRFAPADCAARRFQDFQMQQLVASLLSDQSQAWPYPARNFLRKQTRPGK